MQVSQYYRVRLELKLSSVDKKEWKVTNCAWGKEEFTKELKLVYDFEGQIRILNGNHIGIEQKRRLSIPMRQACTTWQVCILPRWYKYLGSLGKMVRHLRAVNFNGEITGQ